MPEHDEEPPKENNENTPSKRKSGSENSSQKNAGIILLFIKILIVLIIISVILLSMGMWASTVAFGVPALAISVITLILAQLTPKPKITAETLRKGIIKDAPTMFAVGAGVVLASVIFLLQDTNAELKTKNFEFNGFKIKNYLKN